MSRDYGLDLFQNAIDSLQESVRYYDMAVADESKYKFCIILFFHFSELMLKHLVEHVNPLLCYERPSSESIANAKTINWRQATQVLINSNVVLDKKLARYLDFLSDLRNKIIHYKFTYSTANIRMTIVYLASELRKLYKELTKKDYYLDLNEATKTLLVNIEDDYRKQLHLAQADAAEESGQGGAMDCGFCGESDTVTARDGTVARFCHFCREEDTRIECSHCLDIYWRSEITPLGKNEEDDEVFLCDHCLSQIEV